MCIYRARVKWVFITFRVSLTGHKWNMWCTPGERKSSADYHTHAAFREVCYHLTWVNKLRCFKKYMYKNTQVNPLFTSRWHNTEQPCPKPAQTSFSPSATKLKLLQKLHCVSQSATIYSSGTSFLNWSKFFQLCFFVQLPQAASVSQFNYFFFVKKTETNLCCLW